ncbi:LuxR family transcriptional regulator [Mycolicibacterium moriokaense]|nr:LuxR family transcriptional regulator [Mycolicibacterium moriokaense]
MAGAARLAGRGAGQLVLLHGEGGVGRSAVLQSFVESLTGRCQILLGSCDPLSTPRPLGPLIDVLGALPSAAAGRLRAAIDAGDNEAIYSGLLGVFADGDRWVLVIEDAHWADGATLDLLRFVARRIAPLPLVVVVSYRDDELGPGHPLAVLLGDLSNHPALTRIGISPLTADAVRLLAAGSGVNAEQLYRVTAGNSFYVREVLAAGPDESQACALPRSVADAVRGRLARLTACGREAAEAAAVCGPRADPQLIEQVRPGTAEGLGECMRAAFLHASGPYIRFRHELARQATLDQIPNYERQSLHRRALAQLARRPIAPDMLTSLVLHAEQAGDDRAVLRYAPAAAERAAALGDHTDATALYALSLRHAASVSGDQKVVWLEKHALESYLSGQFDASAESWRDAAALRRTLGDHLGEGECLRRLSKTLTTLGRTSAALAAGRQSVRLLEPLGTVPELAWAIANIAALAAYRYRDTSAVEHATRAAAAAEQAGDPRVKLSSEFHAALATVLRTGAGWGELQEAWRNTLNDNGIAEVGGMASGLMCWAAAAHPDIHRAQRYLSETAKFCRKHNLDVYQLLAAGVATRVDVHRGEWDRAVMNAEDLLTRPLLSPLLRIWPSVSLALVRARRGQGAVMPLLDAALDAGEPDDLFRVGAVWAARAEAAWLKGDDDAARADAEKGWEVARASRDPWLGGQLLRWIHLPGSPPTTTIANPGTPYFLEITGDWQAASREWHRRGCVFDGAIAQLGGDTAAVESAMATFRRLGARAAADRARQRLSALRGVGGGRHRGDTRAHPHGLTRREREILELLAAGHSDADIANALYISQRTVNNHVHAILGKLGVNNRTQAAGFAARQLSSTQQ